MKKHLGPEIKYRAATKSNSLIQGCPTFLAKGPHAIYECLRGPLECLLSKHTNSKLYCIILFYNYKNNKHTNSKVNKVLLYIGISV